MDSWFLEILLALTTVCLTGIQSDQSGLRPRQDEVQEYCEDESFHARCAEDEAIVIQNGLYGRMQLGRCISRDYGSVGCAVDVRVHLDQWCSGTSSCEVEVTSLLRGATNPCPKDFRSYLEASYTCVKVVTSSKDDCQNGGPKDTFVGEGYISSFVAEDTGCGSIDAPWSIQVTPGQQINVTLWDFGAVNYEGGESSSHLQHGAPPVCHVYAILKDKAGSVSTTLCGGDGKRIVHAYTSLGNVIEVRVVSKRQQNGQGYFLLHYKAIGCPDIQEPPGGQVRRQGKTITITCNDSDKSWKATCHQDKWVGKLGNCTNVLGPQTQATTFWAVISSSQGLSIAIIVGVAVLVGLFILVAGLVCLRWQRTARARRMEEYSTGTYATGPPRFTGPFMPPEDNMHANDGKPRDLDPYSGGENNYYRTWQLQNHSKPSIKSQQLPPHPYNTCTGSPNTIDTKDSRYTEHVYESPKFERRDLPGIDTMPQQYYELDPDVMKSHNGPQCSKPAIPGNRPSVSTNASEPNIAWRQSEEQQERGFSSR